MQRTYETEIVTQPKGHQLMPNDRTDAENLFIEKALSENPNGTQGNPRLLGVSLVVGQHATWRFEIDLVESSDDGASNSGAGNAEQPSDSRFTKRPGSTSGRGQTQPTNQGTPEATSAG